MCPEAAEPAAHVAAVVLHWNGRDDTLACLKSLAGSDWAALTTIVVDNGSAESIEAEIRMRFPGIEFLSSGANLGFGGGMNVGIRRGLALGADYVLLLNNDTVVDPEMVRTLVETAERLPDAGIVSPLDFFQQPGDVVASAGLRCDLRRGYQGPPLHQGERDCGQFHGVAEVDASSGTAMLVSAEALHEVGLLDEDLFLYIEDVDWSLRMRNVGRRVYVANEARLWHGVAASSGGEKAPSVSYYHTRNVLVVSSRHAPLRGLSGLRRHTEILVVNLARAALSPQPLTGIRAVLAGWRDHLRGRLGARR